MAGTNTSIEHTVRHDTPPPVIILVRPQLGENIGMCARAMLNCAVTELRIVAPRDGWPNPDAVAAASGATALLENAKVYATTAEAVADLQYVVATTARDRFLNKPVLDTRAASQHLRQKGASGAACGIMFGPERTGLENDDLAVADAILNIPLNPAFSSLNLAQAVLLVCFSWLHEKNPFADRAEDPEQSPLASRGDVENLMRNLEEKLEAGGFFRSPDQRPTLMRNIRNFFFRSGMTEQEVRTLHGIFKSLTGQKTPKQD